MGLRRKFMGLRRKNPVSCFWLGWNRRMFGISLPSRCFRSQSLMDGEKIMDSQQFDHMSEEDMLAELEKLQDGVYKKKLFICVLKICC